MNSHHKIFHKIFHKYISLNISTIYQKRLQNIDKKIHPWNNRVVMPKKWGTLLFGTFGLILLATGLVAVIHSIKSPTTSTSDIRARASAGQALKFNATIASIDEASGTIIVENVYMADVSRSG